MVEKARQDLETNIRLSDKSEWTIEAKAYMIQPPPQALRFSHGRGERETRVTGDEPQRTMGSVQTAGEAPARARSCVVFLARPNFWSFKVLEAINFSTILL